MLVKVPTGAPLASHNIGGSLFMTITAAGAQRRMSWADQRSQNPSVHRRRTPTLGISGTDEPPGMTASKLLPAADDARRHARFSSKLFHARCPFLLPPRMAVCTWPERQKILLPVLLRAGPARRTSAAPRRKMLGTTAIAFHIIDRGRIAVKPDWTQDKGGFKRGMPWLAFQTLQQRGFLAANIGAGAAMKVDNVKIPAAAAGGHCAR